MVQYLAHPRDLINMLNAIHAAPKHSTPDFLIGDTPSHVSLHLTTATVELSSQSPSVKIRSPGGVGAKTEVKIRGETDRC